MTLELQGLVGSNPLAFLAALGVLGAVNRQAPELGARLSWTDAIVPRARLDGVSHLNDLVALLDEDRRAWTSSLILASGPDGIPIADVKPDEVGIRSWAERVAAVTTRANRRDADAFQALLAEYALAGKNDAKPTLLHFTAGQQKFLTMVRELGERVKPENFVETLVGPWRYESRLPVLGWDSRGERIYALRGTDPSKDKKLGVPGADWLAFAGLAQLPSAKNGGVGRDQMLTTGCRGTWKSGSFHWPLWSCPLSLPVVRSLLAYDGLPEEPSAVRSKRGVFRVLEAPIRRSDQGGYGSFGPASEPELRRRGGGTAGLGASR